MRAGEHVEITIVDARFGRSSLARRIDALNSVHVAAEVKNDGFTQGTAGHARAAGAGGNGEAPLGMGVYKLDDGRNIVRVARVDAHLRTHFKNTCVATVCRERFERSINIAA